MNSRPPGAVGQGPASPGPHTIIRREQGSLGFSVLLARPLLQTLSLSLSFCPEINLTNPPSPP